MLPNPHNRYYCERCEDLTEHEYLHNTAHGIAATHMAGTERYVCAVCALTTFATDLRANHFVWRLDEPWFSR